MVSLVERYRGSVLGWVSEYTLSDYETQYIIIICCITHTMEIGLAN